MEDEPIQTGVHPVLSEKDQQTLKRKIGQLEAELHSCRRTLGHGSVTLACDMNTGRILSTSVSSLELRLVAEEIKSRAAAATSEFVKAAEMFSGVATACSGAPRLPFAYAANEETHDVSKRIMGRHDCLLFEVKLCKERYGAIKFKHIKRGETEESLGVLDHQHATISQCEAYLRLYYERGNELSPSILKYLNTPGVVTTLGWLTPLNRTDEGPLISLHPLFFNPKDPSITAKGIWQLIKNKSSGIVTIKRDEDDGRKGQGGIERGKKLKLNHK